MMFYQSDLVTLPSRTEGFGLVALEAISGCIPVLVSSESGVAEALKKVEGGCSFIMESDGDAEEWAQRIREMSELSAEERHANAAKLRENYRKLYPWSRECAKFKRMMENVLRTAKDPNLNRVCTGEDISQGLLIAEIGYLANLISFKRKLRAGRMKQKEHTRRSI